MPQPTINQWLQACPLPKNEARLLLMHAGGCTRTQLVTRGHDCLTDAVKTAADALVQRRLRGEPVAYILGVREFYGRPFQVNPNVLIPRPETEHLVQTVIERLPHGGKVWDLGTGSGIIAITVALERPDAQVHASDISPAALQTAQANARALGANIRFLCGSWFAANRPSEKKSYDIIVSNPPYIEAGDRHLQQGDLRFEPQNALTDFSDGLSCLRILAGQSGAWLKNGGLLLAEHGFGQGAAVRALFAQNGFEEVATQQDWAGLDRITSGRLKQ